MGISWQYFHIGERKIAHHSELRLLILVQTMLAVHSPQTVHLLVTKKTIRKGKRKKTVNKWKQKNVGLSIVRLARENHWHRNKASRCLIILRELGLIEKTGNYGVGHRGNVYRIVEQGAEPSPMARSAEQIPPDQREIASDDMADPW